jgi:hypothetical protein
MAWSVVGLVLKFHIFEFDNAGGKRQPSWLDGNDKTSYTTQARFT